MSETMTKERPILFSGEMVRAILDGRKTQTRRVASKLNPVYLDQHCDRARTNEWQTNREAAAKLWSPYGQPGDRLWVREAWSAELEWPVSPGRSTMNFWQEVPAGFRGVKNAVSTYYRADVSEYDVLVSDDGSSHSLNFNSHVSDSELIEYEDDRPLRFRWVPSIHMPRWASRLTLELTGIRVERVQDISENDARAEGCPYPAEWAGRYVDRDETARGWFTQTWNGINAKRGYGWDVNPWVWVLDFTRVEG